MISFQLGLNDSNMVNLCKLMYKLYRGANRPSIIEKDAFQYFPVVLLQTLSLENEKREIGPEALTYLVSCLKLTSAGEKEAKYFVKCGAVEVVTAKILKLLSSIDLDNETAPKSSQVTVPTIILQLLGVLRNISETPDSMALFKSSNTFAALLDIMICFNGNPDIILMCSRILSKSSLDPKCCFDILNVFTPEEGELCDSSVLLILGNLIVQYHENKDITVRLAFAVGNMITDCPESLPQLVLPNSTGELAINLFVKVFYLFVAKLADKVDGDNADAVMKMARLLANAGAIEEVGLFLAASSEFNDAIIRCLSLFDSKSPANSNLSNIFSACLAAINNTGYFALENVESFADMNESIWDRRLEFVDGLYIVFNTVFINIPLFFYLISIVTFSNA